jgi:hypothetical protein
VNCRFFRRAILEPAIKGEQNQLQYPPTSRTLSISISTSFDNRPAYDAHRRVEVLFLKVPYMPEEAIRSVLTVSDHPRASSANPKDFSDNRILKELDDTGFINELYSQR